MPYEYIRTIKTSSGSKQIDYEGLANLPTINDKQITGSVTLTASDVGAATPDNVRTSLDTAKEYTDTQLESFFENTPITVESVLNNEGILCFTTDIVQEGYVNNIVGATLEEV